MEYKSLGRTGLKVSRICLGTGPFGGLGTVEGWTAIMDRAYEYGIRFFDTADYYPLGIPPGRSEEIIGNWMEGKRQEMVIATKCGLPIGHGANDKGLSRKHIMDTVEGSLRRLQTDYIDLYMAHWPDPSTPLEETLRAFDDLVRAGKVRYVGCSNFEAWRLCKALWIADSNRLAPLDCIELVHNLVTRVSEREVLPFCKEEGIGVMVYSPLASGFLSGQYKRDEAPKRGQKLAMAAAEPARKLYFRPDKFDAVDRLHELAAETGIPAMQLAMAWVLHHPAVTSAIAGASKPEHLDDAVKAAEIKLPEEMVTALNEAMPSD